MVKEITKTVVVGVIGLMVACTHPNKNSSYFPLPSELENYKTVRSEAQSFIADTVLRDLNSPYSMAFLPDNKVLVTERSGNLILVENGTAGDRPVGGNIPTGLRDIELHPRYQENGWIYLSYYREPTDEEGGYTVLMRGRLEGTHMVEEEELYTAGPFEEVGDSFVSRIEFNRDGYLLFSVGIRGARRNAQDLSAYSGKTMRLRDDGTIPSDNPFANTPGALPEIYTYGHRMHEGLVRHPVTGEIWSSEHGPMGGDELNIIRAGLNYGWPEVTYGLNYDSTLISPDTLREGMEPPVYHWTPSIAPAGFDFVTGSRYPGWKGNLFIGAMKFRYLNRSVLEGNKVVYDERLLEGIGRIRSIRMAPDGFLYLLVEDSGLIVRLVPVD